MMMKIGNVALVCGLLFGLGCGGDSDDGDGAGGSAGSVGPVDTGLPEATPLENVTAQQYASACQALKSNVSARLGPDIAVRGVCEVYGAAIADDTATCDSAADTCVTQVNGNGLQIPGQQPITRADLDFTNFECGDTGKLQGCAVTVGELETCLEDQISAYEKLMSENNCSNAATVDLDAALQLVQLGSTPPSTCTRLRQECPGVGPFSTQ